MCQITPTKQKDAAIVIEKYKHEFIVAFYSQPLSLLSRLRCVDVDFVSKTVTPAE